MQFQLSASQRELAMEREKSQLEREKNQLLSDRLLDVQKIAQLEEKLRQAGGGAHAQPTLDPPQHTPSHLFPHVQVVDLVWQSVRPTSTSSLG